MTTSNSVSQLTTSVSRRLAPLLAVLAVIVAMGGSWSWSRPASANTKAAAKVSSGAPTAVVPTSSHDDSLLETPTKRGGRELSGKLNLNTANEEQLMLLPSVGPAKAERIVAWRKKNGGFRRIADLRRVKGFGYKTLKKLEPFLDIKGDTTLNDKHDSQRQ
jgi:competence protein ComEA